MFRRLIVLSYRNLIRNWYYAIIIIGGLVLGMITLLSISQWIGWHMSYDKHFPGYDRIYRITLEENLSNTVRHSARVLHGNIIRQITLEQPLPEAEAYTRLSPFRNAIVRLEDRKFYEDLAYSTDTGFMKIFQPTVLQGRPNELFKDPFTVVLTRSTAEKYFGNRDPMGKMIRIAHQFSATDDTYEVTGVIEDLPENTHFAAAVLTSFENPSEFDGSSWFYCRVKPGTAPSVIEQKIHDFIGEIETGEMHQKLTVHATQVSDIHLHSHLVRELQNNLNYRSVMILLLAGFLVFALAWINFALLAISQNQMRINRLIYQWQVGASRKTFFFQFMVDFIVTGVIALLITIPVGLLLERPIYELIGIRFTDRLDLLVAGLAAFLVLILISSALTAWYTTGRLYRILRFKYLTEGATTRKGPTGRGVFFKFVIVLEFVITFLLLSNLFMVRKQTLYSIRSQMGSTDSTTIQIPNLARPVINGYPLFREKISTYPAFKEVTAMMTEPTGQVNDAFQFRIEGLKNTEDYLYLFPVDEHFNRFYNLKILAGRDFPRDYNPEDTVDYYILNETAARMIGGDDYTELIDRRIEIEIRHDDLVYPGRILGVVEDFHLSSTAINVKPMILLPKYVWLYCFSLRIDGNHKQALDQLNRTWEEIYPEFPLRYAYTWEVSDKLYKDEQIQIKILMLFALISLAIAGSGLFALSGLLLQEKMKAAVIRKIHGAKLKDIVIPELKRYAILVLVASAISIPLSYQLIGAWLANYAYRVDVPLWLFPGCILLMILFSWIAVLYHAVRLARIQPADYLKNL